MNREEYTVMLPSVNALENINARKAILTDAHDTVFNPEWQAFKKSGLSVEFEPVILARPEHGFRRKPDPHGLNHIIQQWGFNKEEVLMVGNGPEDMQTARNAGVEFFYINPSEKNLENYAVLESFDELLKIVE